MATEGTQSGAVDENRRTIHGSAHTKALPHRFHGHGLEWSVESCTLDDGRNITVEDVGGGFHVSLLSERDWSEVTLTGTVTVPQDVYDDVVAAKERSEKADPPTRLNIIIDCRDAVLRDAKLIADPAGPGEYEFELSLDRDRLYGTVKLYPSLARREPFRGDSGPCASETGHRLAESSVGTVAIDLIGGVYGLLHPLKREFSKDSDFPPTEHLVHLVLEGKDAPKLYLNADYPELLQVLDIRGKRGKEASLKEVTFDLIEAELWPQLIVATATDIDSTGEPKDDWQWDILRQVAEPLYGDGVSAEDAAVYLRETVQSPDELSKLQMEIEDFVQSRVGAPTNLTTLLEWLR